MNVPSILFLLGLAPTPQGTTEVANQWNQLSFEEKKAIYRQFEEEYKIGIEAIRRDPKILEVLQRKYNLRTHDLIE